MNCVLIYIVHNTLKMQNSNNIQNAVTSILLGCFSTKNKNFSFNLSLFYA